MAATAMLVPTSVERAPGAPWPLVEAAQFLGVSKNHLSNLVNAKRVEAIRIGRRVMLSDSTVRTIATRGL